MKRREMEDLKETLCEELERMGSEEISQSSLDNIYKLTGSISRIDKILMADEYSNDDGYSGARGRYARRDSRGRYSRDMYSNDDYNDGYSRGGSYDGYSRGRYSRDGGNTMMELQELMNNAPDERTRKALQQAMMEIKE